MKATGPYRHAKNHSEHVHTGAWWHETYQRADGSYVTPAEVKIETGANGRRASLTASGEEVSIGGIEKMSKSKRNTVDPDDIIATYGADVARWFMLSDSPPDRDVIWSDERVQGASRFVQRLWRLVSESADIARTAPAMRPSTFAADALAIRKAAHGALDKVSAGIERLHFNVCLAYIREFSMWANIGAEEERHLISPGRLRGRGHSVNCSRPCVSAEECWRCWDSPVWFRGQLAKIERDLLVGRRDAGGSGQRQEAR